MTISSVAGMALRQGVDILMPQGLDVGYNAL